VSVQNNWSAYRDAMFGQKIARATATLPQTTAAPIFTVAGGRIVLTGLLGQVTTIIQTQANATKITANPTTGSDVDLCATVDITALEVGGKLALTPDLDATPFSVALDKQLAGGIPYGIRGIVIDIGTIDLSCAASNTGSVKWDLTYVPFDNGATVVAA
jgi:hypothetical protein